MAGDTSRESSAAAALFQRAHQKMTTLTRVDEQLLTLLDQRRKVQDELKTIQGMINEEFDRITKLSLEMPVKVMEAADDPRAVAAAAARSPRITIPENSEAVA